MKGFKETAAAWAKAAEIEMKELDGKIANANADLKMHQEARAKLQAELAIYNAKKEML